MNVNVNVCQFPRIPNWAFADKPNQEKEKRGRLTALILSVLGHGLSDTLSVVSDFWTQNATEIGIWNSEDRVMSPLGENIRPEYMPHKYESPKNAHSPTSYIPSTDS